MDKYTVKMFPQAYRDIDKIYEQVLLVSNCADDAIALAENLEKAILSLEEQPYRGTERKYGFYAFKGYRQLIVENYIIIYEVLENEKVVAVVTVKYGKSEF
ncbi:Plasmid stabilisation system protein [Dorea longicatena]|uniref:Plasmid stabilisation system protein n=1 Tax=Dorea longicatena TaxID=88431 RepID=A0A564UW11_9FIRM|nr:type II toxin-antitoxin system RelE/ParE family toxin [Dorea longicatena]VUX23814.1 Plasmid stabilisation system protein [Dorea longicatena]